MTEIGIEDVSSSASIFYTTLKNYTEMNDYLKEVVLNHRKEYPETNVTNVKSSWTSSYYTHHETDKFNLLIENFFKSKKNLIISSILIILLIYLIYFL